MLSWLAISDRWRRQHPLLIHSTGKDQFLQRRGFFRWVFFRGHLEVARRLESSRQRNSEFRTISVHEPIVLDAARADTAIEFSMLPGTLSVVGCSRAAGDSANARQNAPFERLIVLDIAINRINIDFAGLMTFLNPFYRPELAIGSVEWISCTIHFTQKFSECSPLCI